MSFPVSFSVSCLTGFASEGMETFIFQVRPFFETAVVHFLLNKSLTLSADDEGNGERCAGVQPQVVARVGLQGRKQE